MGAKDSCAGLELEALGWLGAWCFGLAEVARSKASCVQET